MTCEYCTQNISKKRPSEILMDWCEEMKKYLIYKIKSERKEKLKKLRRR